MTEARNSNQSSPGLARVFRKAFTDIYDRLGLVVAASFIWVLAALVPVTIVMRFHSGATIAVGLFVSFVLGSLLGTGVFYLAHKIVYPDDPGIGDILAGFKRLLLPTLCLALTDLVITGILVADVAFFFGFFKATRHLAHNPAFFGTGILFIWITIFWFMSALYHLPVLIASHFLADLEVRRPTTLSVLKRGILLSAGSPFFTMVLLFVIIAVTILSVMSRFGMAIFVLYPGIIAIILTHATRAQFIKYGVIEEPAEPDVEDDKGWKMKS